jgi:uncharacterized membrane protein
VKPIDNGYNDKIKLHTLLLARTVPTQKNIFKSLNQLAYVLLFSRENKPRKIVMHEFSLEKQRKIEIWHNY